MIIRQKRNENYTVVNRLVIEDPNLDWNALGLLTYLLSRPDHWEVHTAQLVKLRRAGRDAVLAMLRQLRQAGYVVMHRRKDGTIDWKVYDEPQVFEKQSKTDFPSEGKSPDGKIPQRENPAVLVNIDHFPVNTDFLYFWEQYDLKKNQPAAERQWQQLSDEEQAAAILGVEEFKKSLPGWQTKPFASTYLRDKRWLDDLTPPPKSRTATEKKRNDLPFHDTDLPRWAAERGYPPPSPGQTYTEYRNRLRSIHNQREEAAV